MEFFWLVFAHFLADLPLQGDWVAKEKGKEPLFMIGHCVIWSGCIAFTLQMLGLYQSWHLFFLFIGHYIMDKSKCIAINNINKEHIGAIIKIGFQDDIVKNRKIKYWVYLDQFLHLCQLLVVFFL